MSEGKQVSVAFNGPQLEHDNLIDFIDARNAEDVKRSSSAGESRQKIGEFLEETGMNGKALGWLRQIIKVNAKDDGQAKAMDVIMSLNNGLPIIEAHVRGQGTAEMDFDSVDVGSADLEPTGAAPAFENDAFSEGQAAGIAGVIKAGNPHDASTEMAAHMLWNKGWEDAQESDEVDSDESIARPDFGGNAG